ncbi:RadC family protein [Peptostreptococcus equinus]|uniref:DNA repair protein RadC n=1 Tax=Peptostreptococcus equinus TaxID=3003601 RepID=A0ABY7JQ39_9FIRM|nr:DNA repair protein RadC [Peptostreptococcus sp. CBA3647]WAW14288.1 DNA repair protein RadC [Peptostreptococcus sp. CBA3647]
MKNIKIKELCDDQKPVEKMMKLGIKSLSNSELLAILIRTGNKNDNAISLGTKIIKNCDKGNSIRDLADVSIEELCNIVGIGNTKACIIKAAIELGIRVASYIPERYKITNPWDIYEFYMEKMRYNKKEIFKVILLNTKNEIIKDVDVSVGCLNSSIVHPREVFIEAIKHSANAIILMHNHPSGNPNPSKEDINITKRLFDSGRIIGIEVLDHIIIGEGTYVSLKEENIF